MGKIIIRVMVGLREPYSLNGKQLNNHVIFVSCEPTQVKPTLFAANCSHTVSRQRNLYSDGLHIYSITNSFYSMFYLQLSHIIHRLYAVRKYLTDLAINHLKYDH